MPDLRHNPPSRSAVERKFETAQEEALRLIQQVQVSHARARLAMRQIRQIAVSAFLELDETYRTFAALQQRVDAAGDPVHSQWAQDRIGWLVSQCEKAMADVVAAVIRETASAVSSPKPPEQVRESIIEPQPSFCSALQNFWDAVSRNEWVLFLGMLGKGFVQYAFVATALGILFQNPFIAIFVPIGTYFFLHELGFLAWGIIPGVVAFVVWVILLVL